MHACVGGASWLACCRGLTLQASSELFYVVVLLVQSLVFTTHHHHYPLYVTALPV